MIMMIVFLYYAIIIMHILYNFGMCSQINGNVLIAAIFPLFWEIL